MSNFLGKTSHSCGSSDALALYEDTDTGKVTGWCFACGTFENDPTDSNPAPQQELKVPDYYEQIKDLPSNGDPSRGIEAWAFHYFGVKTEVSTVDGRTPTAHFYPYTRDSQVVAYKRRGLPKDLTCVGDFKNVELFGQTQARASASRRLYVTEGELDAVSLYQILRIQSAGTKWSHYEPAVVSICTGAKSAVKDLSRNSAFLKQFEEIVLVMDQDEPGRSSVQEILRLLPTALVATFEEKDANDMLMKGKLGAMQKAVVFNAKRVKPSSVVTVDDVFDRALSKPTMGLSWPWPSLTRSTYGIHRKRIYGLGAGVGMGKTEWAKELETHLIRVHDLPVGVFMLEEDVGRTLKGIAGKFDGVMYHRPDAEFDVEKLRGTLTKIREKVIMYDHNGVKDWDDIKAAIRYMVVSEGIKDIFLDPLTALVSHLSSGDANDTLNSILGELAGMVHELDFTLYYFSHLNTPSNGPPHERGGKVLEQQFTGSRAMMRWSHYLFGLEGNKDSELEEAVRNTRWLVTLKDRDWGNVIRFPMFYNNQTGSLLEPEMGAY